MIMTAMARVGVTRKADAAALGFLALVALVVLWPVTLGDRVLLPADLLLRMEPFRAHAAEYGFERVQNPMLDPIQQHWPWRKFAAEQVRQDQVPLWNPYMGCGAPFLANNQSAPFYPETWLFYLLDVDAAFGWAALMYMLLAGWGMYWYLRTIACRPLAAVTGALAFMLCGFAVGWMAYPTLRSVPAWLPLMLVGYEKMLQGEARPWWLLSALAVGMQFLAGHLQISSFVLLVFIGYVVFGALRQADTALRWRMVGYGAGALLIGCMIGAVQVLPVVELVQMASRTAHPYDYIRRFALVPASLLTGLMPDLFGNPVDYNYWGEHLVTVGRAYLETVWYVGVATLLLAAMGIALWRRQLTWFWLGVVLVGAGLAWGTWLYWLAYQVLPPIRTLPGISRAVIVVDVGLAVLAAMGVEAILRAIEARQASRVLRLAVWIGLACVAIGLIGGMAVWFYTGGLEQALPGIGDYTLSQVGIFAALAIVSTGLICLSTRHQQAALVLLVMLLALDLGRFAIRFIPMPPREYLHIQTQALDTMSGQPGSFRMMSVHGSGGWITRMPANVPMAFGLEDVDSSDSLTVPWYDALYDHCQDAEGQPDLALPVWDALNVRYLLTPRQVSGRWRLLTEYETDVYENTEVLPRIYSPGRVRETPAYPEALQAVASAGFRPREECVLVGGTGATDQGPFMTGQVQQWSPNSVTVELPEGDRWWGMADTFFPGWQAHGGGKRLQIIPMNYSLRGMLVPSGVQQVRLVYYPASYALGAFLAALGFGAIGFLLAWGCMCGRSAKQAGGER